MKSLICFLFFLVSAFLSSAQDMNVTFWPVLNGKPISLHQINPIHEKDSFQLNQLKFYISNVELYKDSTLLFSEPNSFHLVNMEDPTTLSFAVKTYNLSGYNSMQFNVGIDSSTQVSGVMGGDLDPVHGMYWTWQSGYIDIKMEGVVYSAATTKELQYHIGGYQTPFHALRKVQLPLKNAQPEIALELNTVLSTFDLSKVNHIMSPCKESVLLADKIANSFSVKNHE